MIDLNSLESQYAALQTILQENLAHPKVRAEISGTLAGFLDILPCLKLDPRVLVKFNAQEQAHYTDIVNAIASALMAYFTELCSIRNVLSICNRVFMPYHCAEVIQPEIIRTVFWSYGKGMLSDLDILSYCNMVVTGSYLTTFHCDTEQILTTNTKTTNTGQHGSKGAKSSTANVLDPRNAYFNERQRISNSLLPTLAVFKAEISSTSLGLSNECYLLLLAAELVNKLYHLEIISENELEYESLCTRSLGLIITIFNNVWLRISDAGMELSETWQTRRHTYTKGSSAMHASHNKEEEFDLMSLQNKTTINLEPYRQFLGNPMALSVSDALQDLSSSSQFIAIDDEPEESPAHTIAESMLIQNALGASGSVYQNMPKSPMQIPLKLSRRGLVLSKSTQNLQVSDISAINPGIPQFNIRDPRTYYKLNNEDAINMIENSKAADTDIIVMMCKVACDLLVATAEYHKKVSLQDDTPNNVLSGGMNLKSSRDAISNRVGTSVCTHRRGGKATVNLARSVGEIQKPLSIEPPVDRSKTVSAYSKMREGYDSSLVPHTLKTLDKIAGTMPSKWNSTEPRNICPPGTRFNRVEVGKRYAPGTIGGPTYLNDLKTVTKDDIQAKKAWIEAPYGTPMQLNCFTNYNTITHSPPGSGTVRLPSVAIYPPSRSFTLSKMRTQNLKDYIKTLTETYYYALYTSFSSWSSIRHALTSIIYTRAFLIRDIYDIHSIEDACYLFTTESTIKQAISATFIGRAITELFNYIGHLGAMTVKNTSFINSRLDEPVSTTKQKAGPGEVKCITCVDGDKAVAREYPDSLVLTTKDLSSDNALVIQLRLWASQVGSKLVHGGLDVGSVPYIHDVRKAIYYVHCNKLWGRFDPDELCCMLVVMWFFSSVLFEDCQFVDVSRSSYSTIPVVLAESKPIESLSFEGEHELELLDIMMVLIPMSERGSPHLLRAVKLLLGDLYLYLDCPSRCQAAVFKFYEMSA